MNAVGRRRWEATTLGRDFVARLLPQGKLLSRVGG
jgi:hypothetical protein